MKDFSEMSLYRKGLAAGYFCEQDITDLHEEMINALFRLIENGRATLLYDMVKAYYESPHTQGSNFRTRLFATLEYSQSACGDEMNTLFMELVNAGFLEYTSGMQAQDDLSDIMARVEHVICTAYIDGHIECEDDAAYYLKY